MWWRWLIADVGDEDEDDDDDDEDFMQVCFASFQLFFLAYGTNLEVAVACVYHRATESAKE